LESQLKFQAQVIGKRNWEMVMHLICSQVFWKYLVLCPSHIMVLPVSSSWVSGDTLK
jgi:hypothetical protein